MPATPGQKERCMQRKSVLSMAALVAAILVAVLTPRPAAAACFCLAERFTAVGSGGGATCFEAQNNLINNLNFAANQSCVYRGYSGACNVVIRTGVCSPDPYWPGSYRLDGTVKYSCSLCS
jgi:hypothetical protein